MPSIDEELRQQRGSKQKAARISHAAAARRRTEIGAKGGGSGSYDSWTVLQLRVRARELGVTGYSGLNKSDLISELRNH